MSTVSPDQIHTPTTRTRTASQSQINPVSPRREADEAATGLIWDNNTHEWRNEEEVTDLDPSTSSDDQLSQQTKVSTSNKNNSIEPKSSSDLEKQTQSAGAPMTNKVSSHHPKLGEVIWTEWDGDDDPENPFNWPSSRKWMTTIITCIFTLVVAFCGSAFSIGSASMERDLNCSRELAILGLSA